MPASGLRPTHKKTLINHRFIPTIIVASVFGALATLSFGQVVKDGNGYRFHVGNDRAELTFYSCDSTNADAYKGALLVPQSITENGKTIPVKGVTSFACVYCSELNSVVLPEGIEHIGFGAFSDCPGLREVSLPSTLKQLEDWSFYRDESLERLSIPSSAYRIGACSFGFCTSLGELEVERGVRCIAPHAFYYCQALSEVTIPWTVDELGEYAFAYCTGLKQITMEDAPIAITEDVFEGVDVGQCRLVVPTDQVEAYRATEVWCDFDIVDGGYNTQEEPGLMPHELSFAYELRGDVLYLYVNGDAPALVYDLSGRRIAIVASHSGEKHLTLERGKTYLIKCGKQQFKIVCANT